MSYAKNIILGNLGRDPEMRYTPDGAAVTTLNVATSRSYTKNDQKVEVTTWWRITCWRKMAEIAAQYLSKGRQVLLEFRLDPDEKGNPRTFERNDGTWGASYEGTAEKLVFVGGRGGDGAADESAREVAGDDSFL